MAKPPALAMSSATLLAIAACTPAQQAVIDAGLAQGEAGIKAAHDREALALKQAPCAMSVGGYVRTLTSAEQGAVLTLCGGEQGVSFADLANMGRAIQLLRDDASARPERDLTGLVQPDP
jgi:hypothetical protein